MHSVCLILFHLSALLVSGQWQRLYPRFEVVGTSNLHHYQGLVSMAGADNGFLVESTDPPGSSGPSSRIHHTRNDWEHSEHVGGVGGDLAGSCCTVRPLGSYPPSTYFYMVPLAGQAGPLYSLSVVNGQVTRHDFANFPAVIEMICPTSDTTAYSVEHHQNGDYFWLRRTHSQSVFVDTLSGRPRQLAFSDSELGAMLIDVHGGQRELQVTEDGGASWSTIMMDSAQTIRHFNWAPDETLWVVGDSGFNVRSMNRGLSWTAGSRFTSEPILSVAPFTDEHAWVGGPSGMVAATLDGGSTWQLYPLEDPIPVRVQAFPGAVYASGRLSGTLGEGRLFRSTIVVPFGHTTLGAWWTQTPEGVSLLLKPDESITDFQVHDQLGRLIDVPFSDALISMHQCARGAYHLSLVTNKRQASTKFFWPGFD